MLTFDGVRVTRSGVEVVDLNHLEIGTGSTVIVGPNGAGKSTLLECAAGLIRFDGKVSVDGVDANARKGRRKIAYLPQSPSGLERLRCEDAVAAYQALTGGTRSPHDVLLSVDMQALGPKTVGRLSGGQRRLFYLGLVLSQDVDVVLLDEPTAGLDADHLDIARRSIGRFGAEGVAVTATHLVGDVLALGQRVITLDHGRLAYDEDSAAFRARAEESAATSAESVAGIESLMRMRTPDGS